MRQQKSEQERSLVQLKMSLHHCVDRYIDHALNPAKNCYFPPYLNLEKCGYFTCFFCRLKDMESTKNKLLYALKHSGTEKIFEAYQWLQEHRSALNKEVYGPVLLEVLK